MEVSNIDITSAMSMNWYFFFFFFTQWTLFRQTVIQPWALFNQCQCSHVNKVKHLVVPLFYSFEPFPNFRPEGIVKNVVHLFGLRLSICSLIYFFSPKISNALPVIFVYFLVTLLEHEMVFINWWACSLTKTLTLWLIVKLKWNHILKAHIVKGKC